MADPQGRLHALRRSGLPEGLPGARRHRAVLQRHRRLHHENCIGCGYCIKGCPFNIPRISKVDHKAYKCTLCSDRVAVGQGPACAKACPTQAIVFGTKEEMKQHAEARIEDLKSRGFENAGLYDPPGVGGTHVMYVLHHADKPRDLRRARRRTRASARIVEFWKGAHQVCRA